MEQYIIQKKGLFDLVSLIADVIRKPISFYDIDGNTISLTNDSSVHYSEFCSLLRKTNPAFEQACLTCDKEHMCLAERKRDIVVYRCHAGLYECVIPVFDPSGRLLGCFLVGQQRVPNSKIPDTIAPEFRKLYQEIEICSYEQIYRTGLLLKKLHENILSNELLGYSKKPWAEAVDLYLQNHCAQNTTLSDVAQALGYSASFLTHRFRAEFQMTFKSYQRKIRMEYAMVLLKTTSESVKETAEILGFPNPYTFSKMFKEYWKAPPSHFIKSRP